MSIIQRVPWTVQPQYAATVDPSRSIAHVWSPHVGYYRGVRDLAGNADGTFGVGTGGTTGNYWVIGPKGWELKFDSTGTGTLASLALAVGNSSGSGGPSGTKWTFEADVYVTGLSGNPNAIFAGASNSGIEIRVTTTTGFVELLKQGVASIGTSSTALAINKWHSIAVTYDGTNAAFYLNGKADGTASSSQTFSAVQYRFGLSLTGSDPMQDGGKLRHVVITNRVLTPNEILSKYINPWQIFAPQSRRIWAPSAAAPGGFQTAWARNRSYVIGAGAR